MQEEKIRFAKIFQEKNEQLDKERQEQKEFKQSYIFENNKLKQTIAQLNYEKDVMKSKMKQMKHRKVVKDSDNKFCVTCQKEYSEKENFNWSCRVHISEYGDHMWWCCGKTDINAPGCKF